MGFIANTPESMLARSDSKDPATTCRGVTGGGKPCRRPNRTTEDTTPRRRNGKLKPIDLSDETLFCWQHKDQAARSSAGSSPGPKPSNTPILENRSSIDTLADRLGILAVSQSQNSGGGRPPSSKRRKRKELTFCCFTIPLEEEPAPPPRPKPQPVQKPTSKPTSSRPHRVSQSAQSNTPSTGSQTSQYLSVIPPTASPQTASLLMKELAKPISEGDEAGYIYMFWLTPQSKTTTGPTDASRSLSPPSPGRLSVNRSGDVLASFAAAADSLNPADGRKRRASDVLSAFSAAADQVVGAFDTDEDSGSGSRGVNMSRHIGMNTDKTKVLLKIGRANNVQRRLNEWKRQCGFDVSLIRYYPYVSSSVSSGVGQVRKMPHSHKVENLIHIELAGLGLRVADKGKCEQCGRQHREWFEVDATKEGVTQVDELIRRWSDWDEQYNS